MRAKLLAAKASLAAMTPASAAVLPLWAAHATSWFALALAFVQALHQYVPSPFGPLVERGAVIGIIASGGMLLLMRSALRFRPLTGLDRTAFKAYALALATGISLLAVPLFLLLWRTKLDDVPDWSQEFLNKRWLPPLYLLAVGTALVLPPLVQKLLGWKPAPAPVPIAAPARSVGRRVFGLVVALSLGWFLAGPPWHIGTRVGPIDFHEQGHLGPLQGIWNGYLPYIGPASTMYGPGSQLVIFEVMKWSGNFDIVSFREGFATLHLVTMLAVCAFAASVLGLRWMFVALAIGVYWSPLGFFRFGPEGDFAGFWGWSNSVRYLGALVVAPLVAHLAVIRPPRAWLRAAMLGVLWGVTAWMAQENLAAVLVSTALLLVVLWATDSSPGETIVRVVAGMVAGFALVWVPLLSYYALQGQAIAFVRNYLAVPLAVSAGLQNSWWHQAPSNAYRFATVFIVAVGLLTLCDLRRLRLRRHLDAAQARLLAFVFVLTACYQTALHRADDTHLVNTMIALPFVIVLALRDLPPWTAATWRGRWMVRAGLTALILVIFPLLPLITHPYVAAVQPALNRLVTPPAISSGAVAEAERGAAPDVLRRIPPYLATAPSAALGSVSMPEFVAWATDLKQLVGDRKTYVEFVPTVLTGLVYFAADLKQGPYQYDKETMILNAFMLREWFAYFRTYVSEFDCVITQAPTSTEATIFLEAYPDAQIIERRIGSHPFYVLIRSTPAAR